MYFINLSDHKNGSVHTFNIQLSALCLRRLKPYFNRCEVLPQRHMRHSSAQPGSYFSLNIVCICSHISQEATFTHDQLDASFKSEMWRTESVLVPLKVGIYPNSTFWRWAWSTRDKNEIFLPWIFVNTPCDIQTCTCRQPQSQFVSIPYINLLDSSPMHKYSTKKQFQICCYPKVK